MQYSSEGLALTKRFEGLRLSAYRDGAGVLTIGYGHTGADVHEGQTITEPEAEALLLGDMRTAIAVVNELVKVLLTQGQFDSLVDFTYNLGQGTFRRSNLLALVNRRDFSGAARQFGLWVHAGGKVELGLVNRRKAEADMFTGVGQ
jgi:lysozyme